MSASHYQACIAAVRAASGRNDIDEAELERIFTRAQNRTRWYQQQGMDSLGAAQRAGTELGGEIRLAAAIERKGDLVNMLARRRLDARVIPGREYDSVKAALTGVARGTERGLADSVDANGQSIAATYAGAMLHDLEGAGLLRAFRTRDAVFERELANELWRVRDPALPGTGNRHAEQMAQILSRHQDALRNEMNAAGAWIGQQDHYITRQSHDALKIGGDHTKPDEAFQKWRDFILPRLDPVTFRDAADTEALLRNVWVNLSTGVHTTSTSETLAGFKGPANLAKKVSQERLLIFKDADSWFDYNTQFGRGNVADSVIAQMSKGARDLALLQQFGTNPQAMLDGWREGLQTSLRDAGKLAETKKFNSKFPDEVLQVLDGRDATPGNVTLAQVGANIRAWTQWSKLGGVVLSSLPDLAVNASMLKHNGIPLYRAYAQEMIGLLPRGPETQQIARSMGVGIDGMLGDIAHRLGAEAGLSGHAAKISNTFYKWNGLTYWTDSLKRTAGLMLSSNLADQAGRQFAELPSRMQATLRRYGIEDAEWNQIRAAPQRAADGNHYILPEAVGDAEARRKLQTYIIDQTREGMAGPIGGGIEDVHKLVSAARGEGHFAAEAIRMGIGHTPFINLFYARAALDYNVIYRMQEWANPGYLRRMEQRVKRENDQTFWLRPTDAVR